MNAPGIRRPKWYEKLTWITDDGRGVVGYRWWYLPATRLYRAVYFAIKLRNPDE